jgi:hypothetical protein
MCLAHHQSASGGMQEAGLLAVELRGRERVYRLDKDRLKAVAGSWLERFH